MFFLKKNQKTECLILHTAVCSRCVNVYFSAAASRTLEQERETQNLWTRKRVRDR